MPRKGIWKNECSYREIYFMNDFDEYVEDIIDEALHKAVEEIKTAIEGDQDKDSIIEYKPLI